MKITFLGTGTSHGVPPIECVLSHYARCPKGVCEASLADPKHRRTRSSILVEIHNKHILIDVSPDFREQALRERIPKIDAVLLTHIHADHIMGIPDIRSYSYPPTSPIPVYGSEETVRDIKHIFHYIFDPDTFEGGGIPKLSCVTIDKPFGLFGATITPVPVQHGPLQGCFGYRINTTAYIPDLKNITDSNKQHLYGLDCLIIDCLRESRPHVTHIILPEVLALVRDVKPKKCFFVHMCHDIHYSKDAHYLDSWMTFAHDGLTIEV
jgi:phosphoribosyl 1,2-cyclic phosphate phosphodiesterase